MRELIEILIQKKQKTRYGICGDKTLRDVTEELKMQDQMTWGGRMNNIRACAEEIIVKKMIYVE